ncbi:MAG: DUF5908 family protein [Acidobacteriota bacterium]
MPLVVNEIGITMRVTSGREDVDGRASTQDDKEEEREELIEECVRRVLQALKLERER